MNPSRREMLARSILTASAMALAPHVRAQETKKVGFCVVGIGSFDKAKDPSALLVHPVPLVLDAEFVLLGQVRVVRLRDDGCGASRII